MNYKFEAILSYFKQDVLHVFCIRHTFDDLAIAPGGRIH